MIKNADRDSNGATVKILTDKLEPMLMVSLASNQ